MTSGILISDAQLAQMTQDDLYMIQLGEHTSVKCSRDKTLLESLEAQQVDVHYHCREGFCGACRTKLLEGQVEYVTDPLAFIDDDEILPCCCIPKSDLKINLA